MYHNDSWRRSVGISAGFTGGGNASAGLYANMSMRSKIKATAIVEEVHVLETSKRGVR